MRNSGVVADLKLKTAENIAMADVQMKSNLLKGLSHEIFGPVFWPVWIELGLNMNHFWFLIFKEDPLI